LLSKDAAIREVHHRVKNNLQTISSLLSLQARRVPSGAGREELREAERRVRSIALVHEILSRDPRDQVPFQEIMASLVQMAEDSVISPNRVAILVNGDLGEVTADIATPLAVALAEVLQNAIEHAFAPSWDPELGTRSKGHVAVQLAQLEGGLSVSVTDDGCGLPAGFEIEQTTSLGLSIVRDLVVSQLSGSITMSQADGGGTHVQIEIPITPPSANRRPGVGDYEGY
jgi:two-component sensor histidine kinase